MDSLARRDPGEVNDTLQLLEREIRESGITYNVYADPQGTDRAWQVDPLPLLLAPDEWAAHRGRHRAARRAAQPRAVRHLRPAGAARQRRRAAAVVFGHSGYLHQLHGVRPPGGVHLFAYAADLARSPDGRWWVVNDRTQAPSGAGYALENRLAVSRVFPQMFSQLHVQHLASFFNTLRDSLLHWAPSGGAKPLVALLTPGPYNETYSEHALLARYLGFSLVEGSDLTVRDGRVWLKTVEGLQQVHALLRRQDDDYCDPLELRSDSALGIAGLVDCVRRGSVLVANALGAGVLESGALLGYLPRLARELLGEPLLLPSVATWWLGEEAAFRDAWRYLDRLMIKPLDWSLGEKALFGIDLAPAERVALHRRVAAHPQRYVAQEWVRVSQAPVLDRQEGGAGRRDRLSARTMGLRVFAVATPSRLARHARRADARRRRRRRPRHRHAARRPLEGHLGAQRRPGELVVLAADDHRQAAGPGQRARQRHLARGREPVLVRPLRRALRGHRAAAAGGDLDRARRRARRRRRGGAGARPGAPPGAAEGVGRRPRRGAAARRDRSAGRPRAAARAAGRRRLLDARPHVGRQLAHAQPAHRRRAVRARRLAAGGAGLARPRGDLAGHAVGLRARRHDARHRLALPLARPPHRAADADCAARSTSPSTTAAPAGSTGCSPSPTRP